MGDPDLQYRWFGALYTVYGDCMVEEVFRVVTDRSATADWYPGSLALKLVNSRTLYMDARGR